MGVMANLARSGRGKQKLGSKALYPSGKPSAVGTAGGTLKSPQETGPASVAMSGPAVKIPASQPPDQETVSGTAGSKPTAPVKNIPADQSTCSKG